MNGKQPSLPQWCCADCLMLFANDETNPEWSKEERENFLLNVGRFLDNNGDVTIGALAEYHFCTIPSIAFRSWRLRFKFSTWRHPFPHLFHQYEIVCSSGEITGFWRESKALAWIEAGNIGPVADECECETRSFSWLRCDVCGSTQGGSRHAITIWD